MKAQGYLEIDYKDMNDDEFELFNSFLDKYMVHYKKIMKINNREYYYCILRDESKLYDVVSDMGEVKYGLLTLLKDRNLIINGMWYKNGIPFGVKENIIYKNNGNIDRIELIGEAKYKFILDKHLLYTKDDISYDENDNETSRTKVMKYRPLHSFYGWKNGKEY